MAKLISEQKADFVVIIKLKSLMVSGVLLLTAILTGCAGDNLDKIKSYVKAVKEKPAKRIEPLPQVKQYASVVYSAANLPSPFIAPNPRQKKQLNSNSELAPNLERPPEPLESFPLDSLAMVGTVKFSDKLHAIIRDPQGVIYQVSIGNYVGSNYGKVVNVSETEIELNEIVADNIGGWRLRRAAITMGE